MTDRGDPPVFRARPRAEPPEDGRARDRILNELMRLRARFDRAARDGRDAFVGAESDSYDIGMLAVIHLADLVGRELPEEVVVSLPKLARDGLRATRNIAAHNYADLDNDRLWQTVSVHAPALLNAIEVAVRRDRR
jgi:hypothetical protein